MRNEKEMKNIWKNCVRNARDEYISEMSENSSSVVRAYTQAEYDNVDLLSTLDTKI